MSADVLPRPVCVCVCVCVQVLAASQQRSPLVRLTGLLLSSTPASGPQLDLTGLDISLTLSQTLTGAAAGQGEPYITV